MIKSETLKKIRLVYRLTQKEMAALCEVTPSYINMIERGKREITHKIDANIRRELELTPGKLSKIIEIYEKMLSYQLNRR